MDLLDSDIFVLDLRFDRDPRYPVNQQFLQSRKAERATTIFNLLEICGVLSFNLNRDTLQTLYAEFARRYWLTVLFPPNTSSENLDELISGTFEKISAKMTYGDAQILWITEQYAAVNRIISWNTKDYIGRTQLQVMTPQEWLEEEESLS